MRLVSFAMGCLAGAGLLAAAEGALDMNFARTAMRSLPVLGLVPASEPGAFGDGASSPTAVFSQDTVALSADFTENESAGTTMHGRLGDFSEIVESPDETAAASTVVRYGTRAQVQPLGIDTDLTSSASDEPVIIILDGPEAEAEVPVSD